MAVVAVAVGVPWCVKLLDVNNPSPIQYHARPFAGRTAIFGLEHGDEIDTIGPMAADLHNPFPFEHLPDLVWIVHFPQKRSHVVAHDIIDGRNFQAIFGQIVERILADLH